jgi:hypothetical protein
MLCTLMITAKRPFPLWGSFLPAIAYCVKGGSVEPLNHWIMEPLKERLKIDQDFRTSYFVLLTSYFVFRSGETSIRINCYKGHWNAPPYPSITKKRKGVGEGLLFNIKVIYYTLSGRILFSFKVTFYNVLMYLHLFWELINKERP